MTLSNKAVSTLVISIALFVGALALAGMIFAVEPNDAKASAPSGLFATNATTSNPVVTTTASLAIATSSCSARVISTTASPIMIIIGDNQGKRPTATFGFLQPASTTVVYDGGQYGCGAVFVYSFVTGNITVADER